MTVARRLIPVGLLAAVGIFALFFTDQVIQGRQIMSHSSDSKPLLWQGAADRKPAHFIPVEIRSVKPDKGGLFGIQESPSIVGAFPDARNVEGNALDGSGNVVKARAPGAELPKGLAPGQRVVLGLVDEAHVICFLVPPDDLPTASLVEWAKAQRCG